MADFFRFENRTTITAALVMQTALSVGGRASFLPAGSDLPVMKTPEGIPYIPGSSLKGVVRAYLERLLRTMDELKKTHQGQRLWACDPLDEQNRCIIATCGPSCESCENCSGNCCGNCSRCKRCMTRRSTENGRLNDRRLTEERTFRSFTEKVLRTANSDWACDPLDDHACGRWLKDIEDTAEVYRRSCKACKTYGNTRLRGRLSFTDALPKGAVITETRYGVAISRLTNAVAAGPFDMEVLVQGTFTGALVLQNFEVWQFGILVLTLEAINDGLLKLGFGKNRGFGEVTVRPTRITFELAKHSQLPRSEIWGVGAFVSDDERKSYGLIAEDKLRDLPETKDEQDLALYVHRVYAPKEWDAIARKAVESLTLLGANA